MLSYQALLFAINADNFFIITERNTNFKSYNRKIRSNGAIIGTSS